MPRDRATPMTVRRFESAADADRHDVEFWLRMSDTERVLRIDASTFESTLKMAGKVVSTGTNVVSKDGKTMTYTSKGTNASGQATSGVAVFDRQ